VDHDFGGYATKANLKCSDGRTITPEAFKHMDGQQVPLVWQHVHDRVENILGHARLQARDNGIYAYCFFNDTKEGQNAKSLVTHKDVDSLSIFANNLVEKNKNVLHGNIREVSLVLSGANPGARIDYIRIAHSDDPDDVTVSTEEAIISFGAKLEHSDDVDDQLEHKTYQDVFDTLNEEQQGLVEVLISKALKQGAKVEHSATGDDKHRIIDSDTDSDDTADDTTSKSGDEDLAHKEGTMARNVFENNDNNQPKPKPGEVTTGGTLTHSQITTIFEDAKKLGSFKEAVLTHAEDYGITNIEMLFPDAQAIDNKPEWITRRMEWVEGVINGTRKLPWSRIKSMSADLTHEEARAKGYIKANLKKEQFFTISKRETLPKTIYKKQKLDRDDIIDITDFDVVAWLWVEMYFMLREEVARAILVSDGREVDDEDKIDETKIRPIAFDDPFYTDVITVPANVGPSDLVEAVLRGRNNYKGTSPKAYMTNAVMTDMLLEKDKMGRRLYRTKAELAAELQVSEIVEVPVMEGVQRDGAEVLMIIVNLGDYAVGSTKGGEITKFDDFDIDYNQWKYLIEGRMSGALQWHKRAQVVLRGAGTLATPSVPTFVSSTGVITIPTVTGVVYKDAATGDTLTAGAQAALDPGETFEVEAVPATGYYFPHNFDADWQFTRDPA